jgi:hypothetical protein
MFLGGSYHDRDNPHMWGVSHGQLIVFMTIVCNQKEGRQQSSSRRGLRTSVEEEVMIMMMMNNFYGGIGTKPTENQISNMKRCDEQSTMVWTQQPATTVKNNTSNNTTGDDDGDHEDNEDCGGGIDGINRWTNQEPTTMPTAHQDDQRSTTMRMTMVRGIQRPFTGTTKNNNNTTNNNSTNTSAPQVSIPVPRRLDRHEMKTTGTTDHGTNKATREDDDDDGDDGRDHTACDWYTRQKNQPSLNTHLPLQQQTPKDTRCLSGGRRHLGRWQQMDSKTTNITKLTWMTITI